VRRWLQDERAEVCGDARMPRGRSAAGSVPHWEENVTIAGFEVE